MLCIDTEDIIDGEQCGMIESPEDKSPVSAMPQATDSPDDIDVANDLPLVASAAA